MDTLKKSAAWPLARPLPQRPIAKQRVLGFMLLAHGAVARSARERGVRDAPGAGEAAQRRGLWRVGTVKSAASDRRSMQRQFRFGRSECGIQGRDTADPDILAAVPGAPAWLCVGSYRRGRRFRFGATGRLRCPFHKRYHPYRAYRYGIDVDPVYGGAEGSRRQSHGCRPTPKNRPHRFAPLAGGLNTNRKS